MNGFVRMIFVYIHVLSKITTSPAIIIIVCTPRSMDLKHRSHTIHTFVLFLYLAFRNLRLVQLKG